MQYEFPKGFFWGSATSAHQVEGGNFNDWTIWEKENASRLAKEAILRQAQGINPWPDYILARYPNPLQPENYISGPACDHYNRYEEDFDILKLLGQNAHRFSIEWSRIEPEEGKFNEEAIEHYRKVILALKSRGIEPFVTLWHWTNPIWLRNKGGVENKNFPLYFSRFSKFVAEKLKPYVNFWMTLNEPTSVIANSYMRGIWPPQKKSFYSALKVFKILAKAHKAGYDAIHKVIPDAKVGLGNILIFVEPYNNNPLNKLSTYLRDFWSNKYFLKLTGYEAHDYFAIQYYFHCKIKFPLKEKNENKIINDLGWEIYPEGIYYLLKRFKKYNKPLYVTENGLADLKDEKRAEFIKYHLQWVHKAISEGVDVRGYFYWSLLDNFEWDKGFWPRFGLIDIDYKTLERKIRPSAFEYAKICRENKISEDDFPPPLR